MLGGGLRCKDLFELETLKGSQLLAGAGGLDRLIERVNVMEVPDVTDWVRPGEFLMTTGYPLRNDPELFAEMLPKLAEKGVAALGIKTKRFVDVVPPSVIALGNELNLAIIELSASTVFSDVVSDVMEHVLSSRLHQLNVLQERVSRATQLLIDGGGIPELLSSAESFVRCPVLLISSLNEWILSTGTDHTHAEAIHETDVRALRQHRGLEPFTMVHRARRWQVWPLPGNKYNPALIVVIEEHTLSALDRMTIEKIGSVVGLELMNSNARRTIEYKYRDQFVQDWLTGRIGSESDLQLRAEACGAVVDVHSNMCCSAILLRRDMPFSAVEHKDLLLKIRNSGLQEQFRFEMTMLRDELVVVLSRSDHADELRKQLVQTLEDQRLCFCLGKVASDLTSLTDSYAEARRISAIVSMSGIAGDVLSYEQLGVYPLLLQLAGSDELPKFLDKYMTPLREHDEKQESQLIGTLRVYFQQGRNAKAAAGKLFAHYNTVLYRLERVSSLLHVDLNNPDACFQLELALKLHDLMTLKSVKKE